jgi:hypothetical protein
MGAMLFSRVSISGTLEAEDSLAAKAVHVVAMLILSKDLKTSWACVDLDACGLGNFESSLSGNTFALVLRRSANTACALTTEWTWDDFAGNSHYFKTSRAFDVGAIKQTETLFDLHLLQLLQQLRTQARFY